MKINKGGDKMRQGNDKEKVILDEKETDQVLEREAKKITKIVREMLLEDLDNILKKGKIEIEKHEGLNRIRFYEKEDIYKRNPIKLVMRLTDEELNDILSFVLKIVKKEK